MLLDSLLPFSGNIEDTMSSFVMSCGSLSGLICPYGVNEIPCWFGIGFMALLTGLRADSVAKNFAFLCLIYHIGSMMS